MNTSTRHEPPRGLRNLASVRKLATWLPSILFAVVVALAVGGSLIAPSGVTESVSTPFASSPNSPLGADRLGRDVWSRILAGGAPVLSAATIATLVASALGVPVGVLLAGRRSLPARLGQRMVDVMIVVPPLAVLLVVMARVADTTLVIATAIGVIGAPIAARVALAAADPVWRRGHVEQAVLRGETRLWIAGHEVVPSITGPLIADAGLRFAGAVSISSAITVLGYGPEPPATDWAAQLVDNLSGVALNPWASLAPALAITLLAVSANLAADTIARHLAT